MEAVHSLTYPQLWHRIRDILPPIPGEDTGRIIGNIAHRLLDDEDPFDVFDDYYTRFNITEYPAGHRCRIVLHEAQPLADQSVTCLEHTDMAYYRGDVSETDGTIVSNILAPPESPESSGMHWIESYEDDHQEPLESSPVMTRLVSYEDDLDDMLPPLNISSEIDVDEDGIPESHYQDQYDESYTNELDAWMVPRIVATIDYAIEHAIEEYDSDTPVINSYPIAIGTVESGSVDLSAIIEAFPEIDCTSLERQIMDIHDRYKVDTDVLDFFYEKLLNTYLGSLVDEERLSDIILEDVSDVISAKNDEESIIDALASAVVDESDPYSDIARKIAGMYRRVYRPAPVPSSDVPEDATAAELLGFPEVQDPEDFERRSTETYVQVSTARGDKCTFERLDGYEYLEHAIRDMEFFCRYQFLIEKMGRMKYPTVPNPPLTVKISWSDKDGQVRSPKYFFKAILKAATKALEVHDRSIYYTTLRFQLTDAHSVAIDEGGVRRAVFTKAGEHIKSLLFKGTSGRYYLPRNMPDMVETVTSIAEVILVALSQGLVLGVPLSYGLLYALQNVGTVYEFEMMELGTLMELYRRDDEAALRSLIVTVSGDTQDEVGYEYAEYVPETPAVLSALPGEDKHLQITPKNRYEWLKRVIYTKLFPNPKALQEFAYNIGFRDNYLDLKLETVSLEELARAIGTTISHDMVKYEVRLHPETKSLLDQYISSLDEKGLESLYIFVTGALDTSTVMTFHVLKSHRGLPESHTCFNYVDMHEYDSYEALKHDMDIALQAGTSFASA